MSAASVRLIKTCYMFHLGAGDEKAGILQSRSLGFSTAAAECLRVVLWTGWRERGDISARCKPTPPCREWICVRRRPGGMAWDVFTPTSGQTETSCVQEV